MMLANAQSQRITSLPVDSGASRGNQPLLQSKKRSTRDFTIAPVERSSAGTLPLLQKTKVCSPVPPNFLPCGAQNARAGARFSSHLRTSARRVGRRARSLPMLWCLWCLVAAAPIDVPSGIRRVLSSANAAAALGLDDQVQGDRHRIRAAYREAMLAVSSGQAHRQPQPLGARCSP